MKTENKNFRRVLITLTILICLLSASTAWVVKNVHADSASFQCGLNQGCVIYGRYDPQLGYWDHTVLYGSCVWGPDVGAPEQVCACMADGYFDWATYSECY